MIVDFVQRWTERRESRRPAGELIQTSAYDVAEIHSDAIARAFVECHHYSGSYPAARFRFGLYRFGVLSGVAVFSVGASGAAHTRVWPMLGQRRELVPRAVLQTPAWTSATGAAVFPGHLGTIYQATNGRYVGRTNRATLQLLPDGTILSNRAQGKLMRRERGWRYVAAELERWGADRLDEEADAAAWLRRWREAITRPLRHHGNHRYLWCLDRRRRRTVLTATALPYPRWPL